MNNSIKKSLLFTIFYLITSSFIIFSRNLEDMLSTVAQQVHVIVQNKGSDPDVSKQRTAARKEINSVLAALKKDKELTRDATLLGTHVRKLTALAVKNDNTSDLEKDITQNLQVIAQKKINNLEKQITEVVGPEETARNTQIRAMLDRTRMRFYNAVQWAMAPIYPGYHSTPEEKAVAQEMIVQLESQKNLLNTDLHDPNLTRMQRNTIKKQITQIDNEIKQQKIITGQEWTKTRKTIVYGAGTLGAAGLAGLGYYTYRPRGQQQQPQVPQPPIQPQQKTPAEKLLEIKNKQEEINQTKKDIQDAEETEEWGIVHDLTVQLKQSKKELQELQQKLPQPQVPQIQAESLLEINKKIKEIDKVNSKINWIKAAIEKDAWYKGRKNLPGLNAQLNRLKRELRELQAP